MHCDKKKRFSNFILTRKFKVEIMVHILYILVPISASLSNSVANWLVLSNFPDINSCNFVKDTFVGIISNWHVNDVIQ